jgi:hypothetical protein
MVVTVNQTSPFLSVTDRRTRALWCGAVGHAVLAEVSRSQVRGDHFERTTARAFARVERDRREVGGAVPRTMPPTCAVLPCQDGRGSGRSAAEAQQSVCVPHQSHLQRVVVLPCDVQAAGHAHDCGSAVRLALPSRVSSFTGSHASRACGRPVCSGTLRSRLWPGVTIAIASLQ